MIGFIGTGNMGGALLTAVAKSGEPVSMADASASRMAQLSRETGAVASDSKTIAEKSDLIFLGVKPQTLPALLSEIAPVLNAEKIFPDMHDRAMSFYDPTTVRFLALMPYSD